MNQIETSLTFTYKEILTLYSMLSLYNCDNKSTEDLNLINSIKRTIERSLSQVEEIVDRTTLYLDLVNIKDLLKSEKSRYPQTFYTEKKEAVTVKIQFVSGIELLKDTDELVVDIIHETPLFVEYSAYERSVIDSIVSIRLSNILNYKGNIKYKDLDGGDDTDINSCLSYVTRATFKDARFKEKSYGDWRLVGE